MTCRRCGGRIAWRKSRHAWVHLARGQDHAPIPLRAEEVRPV